MCIRDRVGNPRVGVSTSCQVKAKFHYASWFEAGSELVPSWFEAGRRPASNLSAISFEPASVMEFGFYLTTRGYANSRIANSQTGHFADWSTRGLDNSRTGQVADWTARGYRLCGHNTTNQITVAICV